MYNLEGKVALVTGAGSKIGMGHAIALRLARDGADVAVSDLSLFGIHHTEADTIEDWHGLKDIGAEVKALGRKALVVEADISSNEQVKEMVEKCIAEFGKIDILVNNAAIIGPMGKLAFEVSEEDWQRVLAVNLLGTFWCCKAVGSKMIERGQGGKIINIATAGVLRRINPGEGPYLVSKHGVVGITQVLALELAKYRINVNAVCPGSTPTDMGGMGDSLRSDIRVGMSLEEAAFKARTARVQQIPLGRSGLPEDIANVVAFFASSDSDFVTGHVIGVTGGQEITS